MEREDIDEYILDTAGIARATSRRGPYFGRSKIKFGPCKEDAVMTNTNSLEGALNFLLPSTTDFQRVWIGKSVANVVKEVDPKILTIGCSTGLEVYWIIQALIDEGLLGEDGVVTGIDLNSSALDVAKRGVYREGNATWMNNDQATFRDRAMEMIGGHIVVRPHVKRHARFEVGNILDLGGLLSRGFNNVDVLVVMNILKYLTPTAFTRACWTIKELMNEESRLISDIYTDRNLIQTGWFVSEEAGCYRLR